MVPLLFAVYRTDMTLPLHGTPSDQVIEQLESFRSKDLRWKEGRAFSLAYYAGEEIHRLANDAYARFSSENSLNTDAFPSLKHMQTEVIGNMSTLLGGDSETVGVFTSGGTESILTAVKGAREWGRKRGITRPEMVLPSTAHAAFSKAAKYFDVTAIRIPVTSDYVADVVAMGEAVTQDTVLLVGSAPSYPQGVIDPIPELGALAEEFDVLLHVDACMGFTLPWLERLGLVDKAWNFNVPGVTSMSCDLHKYGYTAKGASVLLHRNKELRKHQFFLTSDWLGGIYGSPAILGTRGGGSLAAAWAVMEHLGQDGYMRLTLAAYEARVKIEQGLRSIEGLAIRGKPDTTLLAFGAGDDSDGSGPVDIYAVCDRLWNNGSWYCDRQTPPDSLHCTVNAVHGAVVDEFVAAVSDAVQWVRSSGDKGDRTRAYGTL